MDGAFVDGDIILSRDRFIFYAFGYEHPQDRVLAYVKYVPLEHGPLFRMEFLRARWKLEGALLLRPKRLYSPETLKEVQRVFEKRFPRYLYSCPYNGKTLIAVPHDLIKVVFHPRDRLSDMRRKGNLRPIEKAALEWIRVVSEEANVSMEDFGVHGSLAMGLESQAPDIDVAVYGGDEFRRVKGAVRRLVEEGSMRYLFESSLDDLRRNKVLFKGEKVVFNAIKRPEEIYERYGVVKREAVKGIWLTCRVRSAKEAVFKPAKYLVESYSPLDEVSRLSADMVPREVVSMIGFFRDVATEGEAIEVRGVLERETGLEDMALSGYRVVVGSGSQAEEFIRPI